MSKYKCKKCTYCITHNRVICYVCNSSYHSDCARALSSRKSRSNCCVKIFSSLVETRPENTLKTDRTRQFSIPALKRASNKLGRSNSDPGVFKPRAVKIQPLIKIDHAASHPTDKMVSPDDDPRLPDGWKTLSTDQKLTHLMIKQMNDSQRILDRLDSQDQNYKELKAENQALRNAQIGSLMCAHEIIVTGIPLNLEYDSDKLIAKILQLLELKKYTNDVASTRKLPTPENAKSQSFIVKIKSFVVREIILDKKRDCEINVTDLFPNFETPEGSKKKVIYLNEMLNSHTYKLLQKARAFKKANSYAHCWTRGGQIYVRKSKTDDPIPINSELDLKSPKSA